MKLSLLGISFAFAMFAFASAQAADAVPTPAQVALQPAAASVATEQELFSAFKANINPTVAVKTTGDYDEEDQFVGRTGFPLGGWKEISNPPS